MASHRPDPTSSSDYNTWSHDDLIRRVTDLESQLRRQNAAYIPSTTTSPSLVLNKHPKKPKKDPQPFNPNRYSTRLIALKFAYLGGRYNGYEYHSNNTTPLPTVEEELWKALRKTRLIFPTAKRKDGSEELLDVDEVNWEGCEYSKCGRTDKGVSAFGQVIGVRVRSNRPLDRRRDVDTDNNTVVTNGFAEASSNGAEPAAAETDIDAEDSEDMSDTEPAFDDIKDELLYPQLLNRVLPSDIRVLAWCAHPPENFSARFDCRERRYRYFFTNPAFAPMPGKSGRDSGLLNVEAMHTASKKLEGLHDFRSFCRVDPGKQISNFTRRIFHAGIHRVTPGEEPGNYISSEALQLTSSPAVNGESLCSPTAKTSTPELYYFEVHGSAFLWHQVRHLVAILFLVGQGLESESVVDKLLDVQNNPTKPKYDIASDAPLVLWDCVFPERDAEPKELTNGMIGHVNALRWLYVGDDGGKEASVRPGKSAVELKWGRNGLMDDLWALWRRRKMDELLAGSLMDLVASQGRDPVFGALAAPARGKEITRIFDGGDAPRSIGSHIPIMQRERMEAVEVVNLRYAVRKGLDGDATIGADSDVEE